LTPSKLAKLIGRQVSTISIHLAKLRNGDIVRYDTGRQSDSVLVEAQERDEGPA